MNKRARLRLLIGASSASLVGAVALQACGGDDSNTGDSGPDATESDAPVDTGASDAQGSDAGSDSSFQCPTYTGSSALCKAAVARCQTCGANFSACDLANFTTECDSLTTIFSQPYATALTACATVCDQDAASSCEKQELADASLTAAQQKIATDYCATCGDGGACVALVEKELNVVEYSDTLATAIDNACAPDASSACAGFGACAFGTFLGSFPKSPCADAGTD